MNDEAAPSAPSLSLLQRWMQAVIMHPDGIMAGTQSEEAWQHLGVSPGDLQTVISRSRNLTSDQRLEIYHNAYFSRLVECLRNIYPMVAKTLGEEVFDGLALGYLHSYPSGSYTLDRLGDNFSGYLHESRPDLDDAGEPTETWPDFLIDLARMEWNIGEVFDGPGVEGQATFGAEQLLGMDANRWPDMRLTPAPCLRLLSFRFPVNDYFTSLREAARDELPSVPEPAESWLALSRRDFVVRRHALERAQYELLSALTSGQTIGAAIGELAATTSVDFDRLSDQLRDWFRTWTAAGFFTGLRGG